MPGHIPHTSPTQVCETMASVRQRRRRRQRTVKQTAWGWGRTPCHAGPCANQSLAHAASTTSSGCQCRALIARCFHFHTGGGRGAAPTSNGARRPFRPSPVLLPSRTAPRAAGSRKPGAAGETPPRRGRRRRGRSDTRARVDSRRLGFRDIGPCNRPRPPKIPPKPRTRAERAAGRAAGRAR